MPQSLIALEAASLGLGSTACVSGVATVGFEAFSTKSFISFMTVSE